MVEPYDLTVANAMCTDGKFSSVSLVSTSSSCKVANRTTFSSNRIARNRKRKKVNDCSDSAPQKIPMPRILKSDIRRKYGTLFANVYNAGEYDLMWNFLQMFVCPNSFYTLKRIGEADELAKIAGRSHILAEYWYQRMHDAPDLLFSINQSRLKVRSDGTAVFSTRFCVTGTIVISTLEQEQAFKMKVIDPPITASELDDEIQKGDKLQTNHPNNSTRVNDCRIVECATEPPLESSSSLHRFVEEISSDRAIMDFRPKIINNLVTGSINMHLDSDSRITALEMILDRFDNSESSTGR